MYLPWNHHNHTCAKKICHHLSERVHRPTALTLRIMFWETSHGTRHSRHPSQHWSTSVHFSKEDIIFTATHLAFNTIIPRKLVSTWPSWLHTQLGLSFSHWQILVRQDRLPHLHLYHLEGRRPSLPSASSFTLGLPTTVFPAIRQTPSLKMQTI